MSGFSASEAALEGFRITREIPRAFGTWAAASFGFSVLTIIIDVIMPASVRQGLATLDAHQTLTLGQFADTMILAAPVLIFALAMLSITGAAVYRLILRHDDARFGYLRLGADELRLMGLAVIGLLLTIGLVVGVSMGVGLVLAIVAIAAPTLGTSLRYPAAFLTMGARRGHPDPPVAGPHRDLRRTPHRGLGVLDAHPGPFLATARRLCAGGRLHRGHRRADPGGVHRCRRRGGAGHRRQARGPARHLRARPGPRCAAI